MFESKIPITSCIFNPIVKLIRWRVHLNDFNCLKNFEILIRINFNRCLCNLQKLIKQMTTLCKAVTNLLRSFNIFILRLNQRVTLLKQLWPTTKSQRRGWVSWFVNDTEFIIIVRNIVSKWIMNTNVAQVVAQIIGMDYKFRFVIKLVIWYSYIARILIVRSTFTFVNIMIWGWILRHVCWCVLVPRKS